MLGIELLFGTLVAMSPQGAKHSATLQRLTAWLVREVGERGQVRIQSPFAASDDSETEPDAAVVPNGDYESEHPGRALLLVEVAENSLAKDLDAKAQLYAESGVPEYWVADIAGRRVHVHTRPERGAYRHVESRSPGEILQPELLPGVSIAIEQFLR